MAMATVVEDFGMDVARIGWIFLMEILLFGLRITNVLLKRFLK